MQILVSTGTVEASPQIGEILPFDVMRVCYICAAWQ